MVDQFKQGIPSSCDQCTYRSEFAGYDESRRLQMLDIRNDNLCNLKCRSCTAYWSSAIAHEEQISPARNFQPFDFERLDLDNISAIYMCGGEPFLSSQHQEILNLFHHKNRIKLHYNTNCTTISHKGQYIPDLWDGFNQITVNASIDAVGPYAECVRSGSTWPKIDAVLKTLENLHDVGKILLRVTPYISALNIWWMSSWLERFNGWHIDRVRPIISAADDPLGVGIIPFEYRPSLIDVLTGHRFYDKFKPVVEMLDTVNHTEHWNDFLSRQHNLDQMRQESWTERWRGSVA